MTEPPAQPGEFGIRAVSERTGTTIDTLRWYEKAGLLPSVPRDRSGRRIYTDRMINFIEIVMALRRTGLSVASTRSFVSMTTEGAASHGRRMALLEAQREDIIRQQQQLAADLAAVDQKVEHYRALIASGLDCDGLPVDDTCVLASQKETA